MKKTLAVVLLAVSCIAHAEHWVLTSQLAKLKNFVPNVPELNAILNSESGSKIYVDEDSIKRKGASQIVKFWQKHTYPNGKVFKDENGREIRTYQLLTERSTNCSDATVGAIIEILENKKGKQLAVHSYDPNNIQYEQADDFDANHQLKFVCEKVFGKQ